MSFHDSKVTLAQLGDFIREAQLLVAGLTLEKLLADPVRLRAFERVMELVGESAKRLPVGLRDKYPEIPWRNIVGMRDVITHAYEDLQYEILWDAVQIQFSTLAATVERMMQGEDR